MKKLFIIFVFTTLTVFSAFAAEKPQRFSDDPHIQGYVTIKNPAEFYKKLITFAYAVRQDVGVALEQQSAPFKHFFEKSKSVVILAYQPDKKEGVATPSDFFVYITATDPKIFEDPLLGHVSHKEVVGQTLVSSLKEENLQVAKDLLKSVLTAKAQSDVELFIDLKNILTLSAENIPYFKGVIQQIDSVKISLDITDPGIVLKSILYALDKSNLQVALTQTNTTTPDLLKAVGTGNMINSVMDIDISKFKGIFQDIISEANKMPEITEEAKGLLKELEEISNKFFSVSKLQSAYKASSNAGKAEQSSVIKVANADTLLKDSIQFQELMNKDSVRKLIFADQPVKATIEEIEKIDGFPAYKISNSSTNDPIADDALQILSLNTFYYTASKEYMYSASNLDTLKNLVAAKGNLQKDIALESFNHYKQGQAIYVDVHLNSILELVQTVSMMLGIPAEKATTLKLPPIKIAAKADGNLESQTLLDTYLFTEIARVVSEANTPQIQLKDDGEEEQP